MPYHPTKHRCYAVMALVLALVTGCSSVEHMKTNEAAQHDVNRDQAAVEALAIRLNAELTVENARKAIENALEQRPGYHSQDGVDSLPGAAAEFTFAALLRAANNDPARPKITWFNIPAHRTGVLDVPGSRIGFDNTDRVYRFFPATPSHSYEIHGSISTQTRPLTLLLEACQDKPPGWGYPLAFLFPKDIAIEDDGTFTITIDKTPANGRKNHLQLPEGTGHVLIRDTITEWSKDAPARLTVTRTTGPDSAPHTYETMLASAPTLIADQARYGLEWYESDTGFSGPANLAPNTIPSVYLRPTVPGQSAWGMIGVGKYALQDDEALVFTVEVQNANYVGLQITDPWMISIDFVHHTSTLNQTETYVAPDDTITFVLSPQDPGVLNWLDSGGLNNGVILLRWEQVRGKPDTATALQSVQVVKLQDIASALPVGMPQVNPDDRAAIAEARRTGFAARAAILLGPQN